MSRPRSHAPEGAPASGGAEVVDLAPPHEVRRIARVLEAAGFEAWAVGGAVRDALGGGTPGDWDLTTAATPAEVQKLFRRTVPVGVEHGTVGVLGKDGKLYEVTTFRRDVETFGRRARVAFSRSLDEDLQRRDFTINAVAWNPLTHEVRDPHGGLADLRSGLLRTVGEAEERFAEDRLRVLRALRFAGRFSMRVEEATWKAIVASADRLDHLSAERIREELYKVLQARSASSALRLYEGSGVLRSLYPELHACVGAPYTPGADVWDHLLATTDAVAPRRRTLRLAALLHDVGLPPTGTDGTAPHPHHAAAGAALAGGVMRRLRASNAETDRVVHLVAQHSPLPSADADDPELRRWLRRVGPDHIADLFRLRFADARARGEPYRQARLITLWQRVRRVQRTGPALSIADLAIGGGDLSELGIPRGPLYGEVLRDLLEVVTDEPELNTREDLMRLVRDRLSERT